MTVKGFNCSSCGTTVYSRCNEDDNAYCECSRVQLTGDPTEPLVHINGVQLVLPELVDIKLHVDKDILYWDWQLSRNEYGYLSDNFQPTKTEHSFAFTHEY